MDGDRCSTEACVFDALKGPLDEECANTWETITRAQAASLLSITHGSPTFPMVRSVPQVGQREERRAQSPRGVSHRSYWSAANPFVLVLTDEQRVSSTAARSCDVFQQKPSDHKVAFPQQNLHKAAAL